MEVNRHPDVSANHCLILFWKIKKVLRVRYTEIALILNCSLANTVAVSRRPARKNDKCLLSSLSPFRIKIKLKQNKITTKCSELYDQKCISPKLA